MPQTALIYDPDLARWLHFSNPLEVLMVKTGEEVLKTLHEVEQRVEREGLWSAGFVSYEASKYFDAALKTCAKDDFPLMQFGLFKPPEIIDLPAFPSHFPPLHWQEQVNLQEYVQRVLSIQQAIARGETYQVNLTFPVRAPFEGDVLAFFVTLAKNQPADGAGFLQAGRWSICSVSPELFFSRRHELLTMRPMKGTAARGRTLEEDLAISFELVKSEKNRAENIMILDMVRNDLGRISFPGHVRTEAICALEKYPTVWQMTSTVSARSQAPLAEVFQALFPCASITGAPKAKTMEIIAHTESQPRRIYTGTFGWLQPGRIARFNVAIRTVLVDHLLNSAIYGVGAGITWDSSSEEEYRECLEKAAVLFRPGAAFSLFETMLWTPRKGYFLLTEHLNRLSSSAQYFDFPCPLEEIKVHLDTLTGQFQTTPQRVKLLLHPDGRLETIFKPLEAGLKRPWRLRFSAKPVNPKDIFLYHKTTCRRIYDEALTVAEGADEVILWNEEGHVTECCTANLVLEQNGRFLTPALASGLLPGTYRSFLLKKGVLEEAVITKNDLREARRIFLINALKKWRKAILCG
jgi:para-aminobenzoate synthetase/4-amino-4-deoxychorismate lyase